MGLHPNEYALYEGDKFIDIGTLKELAEKRHVALRTLQRMATPAYRKQHKFEKVILVKLGKRE